MNLRTTILLFSLLPSTAAIVVNDIKHDDINGIRGAVPSPSSINIPTPRTLLTPSVSDATVNRRLGKPTGCKKDCPSPTTTIATIPSSSTTTTASPPTGGQCTPEIGCYFDTSYNHWNSCTYVNGGGSCIWEGGTCRQCNNQELIRCVASNAPVSVFEGYADNSMPVSTSTLSSGWGCTPGDGAVGFYSGRSCGSSIQHADCCSAGKVRTVNYHFGTNCVPRVCDPSITGVESCSTTVSTTTQATTVGSTTTTMVQTTTTAATDPTTTEANAQCAEENEYCKGKDSKPCCPALTCDRDKKCQVLV